jgi:penicillin G amidase
LIKFFFAAIAAVVLLFILNCRFGNVPAIGPLMSPQEGFWQNAEASNENYSENISINGLKGNTEIYLDSLLIPHIVADDDYDLYFAQGYITAKFRLFQMDITARAAGGELSEILGPGLLNYDREQRRKGMVYGAENSLRVMQSYPQSEIMMTAYADGINAFIATVNERNKPVEYKLLGIDPKPWSPLRSALFLKYMADMLTGDVNDIGYTNLRKILSMKEFNILFPDVPDSIDPIVPKGTAFAKAQFIPKAPPDSQFTKDLSQICCSDNNSQPAHASNNWAVSGKLTKNGSPILCNDPHLDLNLPSIWFMIQLTAPGINVFGASLPCAPGVISGCNENIAWGVTNAQRDVKDYYAIKFKDASRKEYLYDGKYIPATQRIEEIKILNSKTLYDTVSYTINGPVMYDATFQNPMKNGMALAVRWTAHDTSSEIMTFYLLNRAKNYVDYVNAIMHFSCPAQNFAFASHSGDIAIWQQGAFPLRWKGQGKFIMPGWDSIYNWRGFIPREDNPHILNPASGFVCSANQHPTDNTYPYYYFGDFSETRAIRINDRLKHLSNITPEDMMSMQNDLYDEQAAMAVPLFLKHLSLSNPDSAESRFYNLIKNWNYVTDPSSVATTVYRTWRDSIYHYIWDDEFASLKNVPIEMPEWITTYDIMKNDTNNSFLDNINTQKKQTLSELITMAFTDASQDLVRMEKNRSLAWGDYRGTNIIHIALIPAFSQLHLRTGGDGDAVDAITLNHGPSVRLINVLSNIPENYFVYPGGQSGNPGSKHYTDMLNNWMNGKYYHFSLTTPSSTSVYLYHIHLISSNANH